MITERKAANAIGGKTARACDGCLQKRARWYCAADDAFLCQTCDSSVHCANQLAGRHERVRIDNASSNKSKINGTSPNNSKTESEVANVAVSPVWHQGFTKKARTPRPSNRSSNNNNNNNNNVSGPLRAKGDKEGKSIISHTSDDNPLVPEIGWEEEFLEDEYDRMVDENLLFQVPVFDPFDEGIEGLANNNVIKNTEENFNIVNINIDEDHDNYYREDGIACGFDDNLHGFLPSDLDLAEFAADVESLLGGGDGSNGLDEDSCDIKGFGLSDCKKESDENNINNSDNVWAGDKKVKVKDEENEALNWQMEYELSPVVVGEEEEKVVAEAETTMMMVNLNGGEEINKVEVKRSVSLRLNYEAVINAWASQGCPWTTGRRPEFNPNDDCWPDCMSACSKHVGQSYGGLGFHTGGKDGGREAKVSRYREKRRTRLFSKKIRYEVRKLNAEKRPRMKGRFVKRTSLLGTTSYPNYQ